MRHIIEAEIAKASARGVTLQEVIVFSDRCGEQFSGKKNFRMCSETAVVMVLVLLWIFACPHHFAGVWDSWGGTEAKLLRNVEKSGKDTMRTVIDCVVKLRHLRSKLIVGANHELTVANHEDEGDDTDDGLDDSDSGDDDSADVVDDDDNDDVGDDDKDDADDDDNDGAGDDDNDDDDHDDEGDDGAVSFKVHGAHVMLLQQCKCRNEKSCTCVADDRVPDTIFYRRDPDYDAETIKGCASMFAYRYLPRRKYVVHVRQYACETCAGCRPDRGDNRYNRCENLQTVRATSYKGPRDALRSELCTNTGWVEHKIRPIKTTALMGTRATDGLTRVDYRRRLEYVGGLRPGANVFMCNPPSNSEVEFRPRHFWLAQLLTPPEGIDSVVWKTRHALPPDCNAGTYCCKIQWFQRVTVDSRRFRLASAQYISLSCIVPIQFPIVLSQKGKKQFVLSVDTQEKILKTMTGLVIDD